MVEDSKTAAGGSRCGETVVGSASAAGRASCLGRWSGTGGGAVPEMKAEPEPVLGVVVADGIHAREEGWECRTLDGAATGG